MTSSPCNATLARTISAGVAALVMAASAAAPVSASSPASEPRLHELCAGVTLPECERQVLASRGIGAPAPAAAAVERAPSSDAGFDWTVAAVGAAGMAGVSLVGLLGVIAFHRRRRLRLSPSAASH